MIKDVENTFSAAQNLTVTAVSSNVIRRKAKDISKGTPLALLITVRVKADATTGDETYAAQLQMDDNVAFSSPTSVGPSISMPRTDPAGKKYVLFLPPDVVLEEFLRVNFTLGGTTPIITVDAELVPWFDIQNDAYNADAITIQ